LAQVAIAEGFVDFDEEVLEIQWSVPNFPKPNGGSGDDPAYPNLQPGTTLGTLLKK
jgi:hypothetical protein